MAEGKFKNLCIRTLSGAVYVSLMVLGVFFPWVMTLLMCFFTVVGLIEYFRMNPDTADTWSRNILIAYTAIIYLRLLLPQVLHSGLLPISIGTPFAWLSAIFATFCVVELFLKREEVLHHLGKSLFAVCWIMLPMILITLCSMHGKESAFFLLLMFVLIWLNDSFAYLGGSLFGKHKMIERISPNKTWEGTLTGVLMTVVASIVIGLLAAAKHDAAPYVWPIFGLLVSAFATLGDLLESLLKRQAGIKDSGNIMPGHGGILDRMDSILFTTYPVALFMMIVCR